MANRFTALEKIEDESLSHPRVGGSLGKLDNVEVTHGSARRSDTYAYLLIFIVEKLEKQIRIFNMTRYGLSKNIKSRSLSENNPVLSPIGNAESIDISRYPPSYIPPHRQHIKTSQEPNSKENLEMPQINGHDKPIIITIEDVEKSWFDCLNKGIFII